MPKPAALRQRRNATSTRATLPSTEASRKNKVPPLPKKEGGWHPMTQGWWESVWRSPMASEYLDADVKGGLYHLARLHDAAWVTDDPRALTAMMAEIRLQEVRFGLSPMDRRRLQWEVEKGEQAAERTKTRRQRKAPAKKPVADPRSVLRAV